MDEEEEWKEEKKAKNGGMRRRKRRKRLEPFPCFRFDLPTLPVLPKPPAVAENSTLSINLRPRLLGVVTPAPPRESAPLTISQSNTGGRIRSRFSD